MKSVLVSKRMRSRRIGDVQELITVSETQEGPPASQCKVDHAKHKVELRDGLSFHWKHASGRTHADLGIFHCG